MGICKLIVREPGLGDGGELCLVWRRNFAYLGVMDGIALSWCHYWIDWLVSVDYSNGHAARPVHLIPRRTN